MFRITCEMCGSNNLIKQDGEYVCQHCGTKYSTEEAKKLMVEVTGTVDVSGSKVKIDESEDLEKYYELARRARDSSDSENGSKYYGLILEKKPNDWEAAFYSLYFRCLNIKGGNIPSTITNYVNSIDSILQLLEEASFQRDERNDKVIEIITRSTNLFSTYTQNTDTSISGNTWKVLDYSLDFFVIGEIIVRRFEEEQAITDMVVKYWETMMNISRSHIKTMNSSYFNSKYKTRVEKNLNLIKKYDNNYNNEIKPGACYIATCVYGSYDCPQVWTLRRYRDYTLAETWYGRAFIHTYYTISPTIVRLFGNTAWFKKMWRGRLDKMVKKLQTKGVEDTPYDDRQW